MNTWEGEFVPTNISSRVLQCDKDTKEKEGYVANLEIENFKNNLDHAVNNAEISDSGLLSGCLYTDVDDTQEHPPMKLVSAITNHKKKSNNENANIPILSYKNSDRVVRLNNWENPEYFTTSFPSLFPFGIGGHVCTTRGSKKRNIPLELWGK